MSIEELLRAMEWLKVETGSLACLGCECESNCSVHGCRILREAIAYISILEQKKGRWIQVTERFPDCEYGSESKPLFFVTKSGDIEAGYFGKGGINRDNYFRHYRDRFEGYDADDIVCWMWQSSLLEPPKEDAT